MKIVKNIVVFCSVMWLFAVCCFAIYGLLSLIEDYQYNKGQIICKESWSGIVKNRKFDVKKDHLDMKDGTTLEIPEIFALSCCDCGLSHLHRFYEKDGKHYMSFWRNKSITKLMRETKEYPCKLENLNLKTAEATR